MATIELLYDEGEYEDYVYDLQTEDGTFQAGSGDIIVKNTDSIYTEFQLPERLKKTLSDREKELKIWEVSEKCANRISETFKPPIFLELELVMEILYLFKKKRYMLLCKEHPDGKIKQVSKGLPTVRRDNCPYTKEVLNGVIEKLLYERSIESAEQFAKSKIEDLLTDKVPVEKLTISKSLKSNYKTENKAGHLLSKPPHVMLAERVAKRDPASAYQPGDRIPYVFTQSKDKNALQGDKCEDPEYVKTHPNLKIDSLYYLDHQISKPLYSIFELTVKDPKTGELFKTDPDDESKEAEAAARLESRKAQKEIRKRIWAELELRKKNQMSGQRMISDYFKMAQNTKKETDLLPSESSGDESGSDES